jgi:hypothetical protein
MGFKNAFADLYCRIVDGGICYLKLGLPGIYENYL